jgi:hypothetical protein
MRRFRNGWYNCHLLLVALCLLNITLAKAQRLNSQLLFTPQYSDPGATVYRSAQGVPGPQYWQNRADYVIHATLNDKDSSVTADVTINYTNNSPDSLDYVWLQLDQNLFDPNSRGALTTPVSGDRFDVKGYDKGGYHINTTTITYAGASYLAKPIISDARMQLRLKKPMHPKGDKISIKVTYSFSIPTHGADRMGRFVTKDGPTYELAEWYPRMCVYDDVRGWNTLPYMGLGEFYCEYGNFDYYITVPASMIVYGSGDLQNAAQVLTAEEVKRLSAAAKTDKTMYIIRPDEIGKPSTRPADGRPLTWHYKMNNTRDVAWTASAALVWDAARINFPSGRNGLAMSAYPVESIGDSAYSRGTEYLKNSIEIYSKTYFEYPWNNAVNIGGTVTGMEYPGIIYDSYKAKGSALFDLITHEIGHNWYPMIVGSNERESMWQDEGFNTFINWYAEKVFNNGELAKDTILLKSVQAYNKIIPTHHSPLITPPEAMPLDEYGDYYFKTALGLTLLRNEIVGADRFDFAFRKYTSAWALRHPTSYDFFHAINNAAGENLEWFWKSWFFSTATLDQAIADVKINGDSTLITVENKGGLIMPVTAKMFERNGDTAVVKLPIEIWQRGGSWTFRFIAKSPVQRIVLDPEQLLPDTDRTNNQWAADKK